MQSLRPHKNTRQNGPPIALADSKVVLLCSVAAQRALRYDGISQAYLERIEVSVAVATKRGIEI